MKTSFRVVKFIFMLIILRKEWERNKNLFKKKYADIENNIGSMLFEIKKERLQVAGLTDKTETIAHTLIKANAAFRAQAYERNSCLPDNDTREFAAVLAQKMKRHPIRSALNSKDLIPDKSAEYVSSQQLLDRLQAMTKVNISFVNEYGSIK